MYYHGTDTVELTDRGGVKINGVEMEVSSVTSSENGTLPLYLYDGVTCSNYTVTIDGNGTKTLQVTYADVVSKVEVVLQIVVSADGTVTAGYKL